MKAPMALLVALLVCSHAGAARADDDPLAAPAGLADPCVTLAATITSNQVAVDKASAAFCFAAATRNRVQVAGVEIASTLITTAGEIVIDRATAVAWGLLAKKLSQAAGCAEEAKDAGTDRLPGTCAVLRDLRLQDLLASPSVLLDAAIKDLVAKVGQRLTVELPCRALAGVDLCLGDVLGAGLSAWVSGGTDALVETLRAELTALSLDALAAADATAAPAPLRGASLFARCALATRQLRPLPDCPLVAGLTAQERAAILPFATLVDVALRVRTPSAVVHAVAAIVNALEPGHEPIVSGLETLLTGLVERDWSRASSGAIAIVRFYAPIDAAAAKAKPGQKASAMFAADDSKLFRLLASVGQYAATYIDKDMDGEAANAARRKAIRSLIDSMTDRSQRTSGVVVSFGGQFGLGYAQRSAGDSEADGTPFHLAFGFGLDWYFEPRVGLHAMLTLVDASQYVAFADRSFSVVDPDAKASLAMGGTLGLWFIERQTPLFVGVNYTYSPFVDIDKTDLQARGSHQLMALVGVYVPFIDFN